MKKMKKLVSSLLVLTMVFTFVFASGNVATAGAMDEGAAEFAMTQQSGGGGNAGGPPGGGSTGASSPAAIFIQDGKEDTASEYEAGKYSDYISEDGGVITIKGLELTNGDYTFNGIMADGESSKVRIEDCVLEFGADEAVTSDATGGAISGMSGGGIMYIANSKLIVTGAARYATSVYGSSKLVVNDSVVQSTGSNENTTEISAPMSNEALLISGAARANFSIGNTQTYYFNSDCIAEGWAALSTDSATGSGLDLYAYNTNGIAENGGYGTYADTNCRVYLYGSTLKSAEIGAIISKTGQIHAYTSDAAPSDVMQYNEGETVDGQRSTIIAGRNGVMMHAPDMMGGGAKAVSTAVLELTDTDIITTTDLVTTEDYAGKYGEAVGKYVDYMGGADLLVKSTSVDVTLDNCTMESYSGVLVMSLLNADSMGNFLQEGDALSVPAQAFTFKNMEMTGDILHMDYHRFMEVTLENTVLNGDIVSGTFDSWNELWADYAAESPNWLPDSEWTTLAGAKVTLNDGAVWNVGEKSVVTSLTVNKGATVNGNVYVDGEQVTVEEGKTYTGYIVLSEGEISLEEIKAEMVPLLTEDFVAANTAVASGDASADAAPAESADAAPSESSDGGNSAIIWIVIIVVVIAAVVVIVIVSKKGKKND